MPTWDVAIVGAGPAGSAAALTFRDRYPALSVCLMEASQFEEPRVGEILSPAAASVLEHLGVTIQECSRPIHASAVSWGREALTESPQLFSLHGPGWHLDRARFDSMLADEAERRGVEVRRGHRIASADDAAARFVIDATGRNATIARAAGTKIVSADHLVGFACFFHPRNEEDPRTLIESVEYGWWYTGALKDGFRVAACVTDADIGRDLNLSNEQSWRKCLQGTLHIARAVGDDTRPVRGPVVKSAASQHLDTVHGANWLAAGDAALALDPLSGQGILAALRSGIFAAYAAGDLLSKGDESGLPRYRHFIESMRDGYYRSRMRYYGEEQRWPRSEFWQRRQISSAATSQHPPSSL